jgi:hypothetical protein
MTFNFIPALLGALILPLALPAQTVRFRTLAWSDPIEGLLYDQKGKAVEVAAYNHARSPFYQASADRPLVFYRLVPHPDAAPTKEIVAEATLPPDTRMALLLFFKGAGGEIRINVSPDDTTTFPSGSYRFVNLSDARLAVAIGATQAPLPPRESIVVKGAPEGPAGGVFVRMALLGETNLLIYSNKWLWSDHHRTLVFVSPTGNPNQPLELKRISENSAFPEDAPAGAPK